MLLPDRMVDSALVKRREKMNGLYAAMATMAAIVAVVGLIGLWVGGFKR